MNYKHGLRRSKVYSIWRNMRSRCENPNVPEYPRYGGRGITVCETWVSFEAFLADMGLPPKGQSLERKDNDLGYSPENCKWATRTEQNRNKRNNVLITIDGETHPVTVWATKYGIGSKTIYFRIHSGWPHEEAVKTPPIKQRAGIPRGTKLFAAQQGVLLKESV